MPPKRIVLDCFYLLIFHFETDLQLEICHLPFAVCRKPDEPIIDNNL